MPDDALVRVFRLALRGDRFGVGCDSDGAFIGPIPLIERRVDSFGRTLWKPRPAAALNRDLSFCYGLPVNIAGKAAGLAAISNALNDGALLRAQIATLHLQLPDLPRLADGTHAYEQRVALAKALHWSGLLKADWDPARHPRLGGPPNAGWFAPTDAGGNTGVTTIADSYDECLERCYALLDRPKSYKYSDLNEYAFRRCRTDCRERFA